MSKVMLWKCIKFIPFPILLFLAFWRIKIENNYSKSMMLLDEMLNKAHIVAIQGNAIE
ncbi:TPA: hypothetical protein PTW95_003704 [Clostridium botulinum]|uniref:hypothetical protein n=1 Tax=Clostridium botulinum TaxID=1491 RepID=UPI0012B361F0|nr:hypothetical protein [Clostridium botulinum]MBY6795680.1 hypothetical protein [Clostridium botulinum]MBY6865389.1 hypothetical protein [Clostridium botulinum]MBY6887215.1 hypothetical protein [Clostridium botulinum]MBY7004043.1 hypothetical protein [Clostridium botulinum]HBJ2608292.1 hypothetical protein [Clostridium botulinum]